MTEISTPDVSHQGAVAPVLLRGHAGGGLPQKLRRNLTHHDAGTAGVHDPVPPLSGPAGPQANVPAPSHELGHMQALGPAKLWVVGAHGGAGVSTLLALGEPGEWSSTDRAWPYDPTGGVLPTVLVARTSAAGLLAAQSALTQWAGGGVHPSVRLLGLVLAADAPGHLPKPLRDLAKVVGGGAPRTWSLPWSEAVRLGGPVSKFGRPFTRLASDLRSLASPAAAGGE